MTSPDLTEAAMAKVNLFLHVTGKRTDGFHTLDSLAVFAQASDRIGFLPSDDLTLRLSGPFAALLTAEPDNLVLRAARRLAAETGVRPTGALTLNKQLPVAAGIGGGSADAAAALRLLCRAWRVNPGEAALNRIAASLGADVPVCLRDRPMRMRGIGERLTDAPTLPETGLLLVNPGRPLGTPEVFRARTGGFSTEPSLPPRWDTAAEMAASLARLTNDLEPAAISLVPEIADVLRTIAGLQDCLLARMSGSGATCFGLFATAAAAREAASRLARPGWWCSGGGMAR